MAALDLEITRDGLEVHDISSIHPKRDTSILNWISEGLLAGLEKDKGRNWFENLAATNMQQPQINATLDKIILYDTSEIRKAAKGLANKETVQRLAASLVQGLARVPEIVTVRPS